MQQLRQQLVQTALKWEQAFGNAPSITSTLSEYDAAMLLGLTPEQYSGCMYGATAVQKGYDFVFQGKRYQIASSPMPIVVPVASPLQDLKGKIAVAKERKLNAGSSGSGTPPHLTLALFNDLNKSAIQHVPYKGGAPCMTDLIGGQIDVVFFNIPESIPHVKGGKLRALAIASKARYPLLPEVPTTTEAGMPTLQVENWTGMMAPAGMPDAAVQKLGAEVVKILAQPGLEARMRQQGFVIDARGPERFAPFLTEEIARWAHVIKAADIQPS